MANKKIPVTPAIRELRSSGLDFKLHSYTYEEKGGTAHTAHELKVDEYSVIKTITFCSHNGEVILMLQHGNCEVSAKELARIAGYKSLEPCTLKEAQKATGYIFGGTSPFGTKKKLSIFAEESIFELPVIFINAGKQGLIAEISPNALLQILNVTKVKAKA